MSDHKTDMLAAVMDEFDLHTLAYIGDDEEFAGELAARIKEREVYGPGDDKADCVFVDNYTDDPDNTIKIAYSKVKEGGFLLGSQYAHSSIEIMRAVSRAFNLMLVQVGPRAVWCVRK